MGRRVRAILGTQLNVQTVNYSASAVGKVHSLVGAIREYEAGYSLLRQKLEQHGDLHVSCDGRKYPQLIANPLSSRTCFLDETKWNEAESHSKTPSR